ncbi:MAG TPA: hypothetical protein VMC82_05045 [Thermoplasmata archaeon]|nr:hypothetical protein [Thermoplasmata archaeon]
MFYNPAMAGDRDLAVAFAAAWHLRRATPASGWDGTAATGVRGLRLLHESGAFDRFVLTEGNDTAWTVLATNAARYTGATALRQDARSPPGRATFDYVDVDPYGSPIPFIPAGLEAVRPGGVLVVTATDMMVLAGVQAGAAERRYGSRPIRGRLGPEGGLRILLAYLARAARSAGLRLRPLLSYVRDHHVRAYVEVSREVTPDVPEPVGTITPGTWAGPALGEGGPYGPFWLGPLFDAALVGSMEVPTSAATPEETGRFLARLKEEVSADEPFYYEANVLAKRLQLPRPPSYAAVRRELLALGYRVARTHARPEGFRTDAPRRTVEEIARALGGRG